MGSGNTGVWEQWGSKNWEQWESENSGDLRKVGVWEQWGMETGGLGSLGPGTHKTMGLVGEQVVSLSSLK